MAQTIFAESIEAATLTLTSGAGEKALLKNRNQYSLGINAAAGTSTITLEIDYGTATSWDYAILANATTTTSVTVAIDYWDGGAWQSANSAATTLSGHVGYTFTSQSGTKWRIVFTRGTSTVLKVGCVFSGVKYAMPVSYDYNQPDNTFMRAETQTDFRGQPYGFSVDTSLKYDHALTYGLTKTQITLLKAELVKVDYWKPFFWVDTNFDSTYRFVKPAGRLEAEQPGADYFKTVLRLIEL